MNHVTLLLAAANYSARTEKIEEEVDDTNEIERTKSLTKGGNQAKDTQQDKKRLIRRINPGSVGVADLLSEVDNGISNVRHISDLYCRFHEVKEVTTFISYDAIVHARTRISL